MPISTTPLIMPVPPSVADERTPCLLDLDTLDHEQTMESTDYRRSKRTLLTVSLFASAILLILSQNDSFPMPWENRTQMQSQSTPQNLSSPPQIHSQSNPDEYLTFDDFLVKFDKTYPSKEEHNYRKIIYETNVEAIQNHNQNAEQHGWTMGITKFADMQPHEIHKGLDKRGLPTMMAELHHVHENNHNNLFASLLGDNVDQNLRNNHQQVERTLSLEDLPESVDWRTHSPPVATPVKDQGHCGSCWAFPATAVLELHAAIATKELFVLSPQELVSCAPNPNHCGGDGGCTGSTGELAYEYVANHGMVTEWEYASSSNSNTTITGPRNYMNLLVKRATMKGFVVLDYKKEYPKAIADLMQWIAEGKITCYKEDTRHVGIANFYPALLSLFEGTNIGKVVLTVQNSDRSSERPRSKL